MPAALRSRRRLTGSFISASYAACSCFLIASIGSSRIFEAVSLAVLAFCSVMNDSSGAPFSSFLFSVPLISGSILRLPSRYPSVSSVVPVGPAEEPLYIQSTRTCFLGPPAASCISWSSWIWRSSCRSFIICSIRLRSSSAFFSSSHTRF